MLNDLTQYELIILRDAVWIELTYLGGGYQEISDAHRVLLDKLQLAIDNTGENSYER